MLTPVSEYYHMFWSTVVGSVFMGWGRVMRNMMALYGDGHLGYNLQMIWSEEGDDEE
jgi:hypothetical protein